MTVKKLILLLSFSFFILLSFAQTKTSSYDRSWKKIDSLINKTGLAKTALNEVNTVYAKAKKENNSAQLIKALIYRANLSEQLTDNDKSETFSSLENEIASAQGPAKSVLQSILATSYRNYLQRNRYKFYGRTTTVNFIKDDPATWSIDDLNAKISSLYLGSLSDISVLKETKLTPYDAIISKGNVRFLRPTLFDLLAHQALDYFKNDERNITRPAYAFEISDTAAFAEAAMFATHPFNTPDSSSLHFQALLILQQLIAMHLHDARPDALIDADIERMDFVKNNAISGNKNELYKTALEKIIAKYPGNPVTTQAIYLLAEWYAEKAASYDPLKDTSNRYAYNTAKELCEKGLLVKDSSEGRVNCASLLKQITRKKIETKAEQVNVPGQPFRMLLTYRNVPTAYFRIIKLNAALRQKAGKDNWSDAFWQQFTRSQPINQFSNDLPETKDHQDHRTEIKIDALPVGEYALIASAGKDFALKDNTLALQYFYVSNIAYISKENNYYVLDRQTGAPLGGADIQVWKKQYDYQEKQDRLFKASHYTADKNGFFIINDTTNASRNTARLLDISYRKDRLFINEDIYSYAYNGNPDNNKARPQAFLFTDRSIYRPGQLLYFKGILVNRDPQGNPSVFAHHPSMIKLYDANNQAVDSLSMTTNEFGSYAGKFTLPSGQLNGMFYIREEATQSQSGFSVEEYKRPKFFVEIKKPSGTYRLRDTIRVEGVATSYAGNNIDGASVNYRVTRKMNTPYFSGYVKIWPPYRSGDMEIAHGSTKTDANGKFIIHFRAIPDNTVLVGQDPVFNYEVTADITDINGETRTGNTSVTVGYQALKIALDIPESLRTDSLQKINIATTNMNGVFEKARVNLSIQKLVMPSRIFRERYWEQPDQFTITREDYYKNFPYDPYIDENDMSKWPVERKIFETSGSTAPDSAFNIRGTGFQPGWYVVEASSKDQFNEPVNEKKYIRLYDNRTVSSFAIADIQLNKSVAEPGDRISYRLATNLDNIYIIHELIKSTGGQRDLVAPGKNPFSNNISITDTDRGDISVNMAFIKNNRIYSGQQLLSVPYFNKQLKIDYTTFRDKTLPGTNEKWKVKISGYKKENVAAELLTSMYDASLDQFSPHSWTLPSLWFAGTNHSVWAGEVNFKMDDAITRSFESDVAGTFDKNYDQLLTINGGRNSSLLVRGMAPMAMAPMKKEAFSADASGIRNAEGEEVSQTSKQEAPTVQPRQNLNETAFFFPDLHTDSSGNIELSFTTPEALTTWKWMLLAHTRDLAFGYGEKTMITQKQLMVQPNAPRFLRAGDRIDLPAKIVNMTGKEISGTVTLRLTDALTGKNADAVFNNKPSAKAFTIAGGQSAAVAFNISIPTDFTDPVTWSIVASSGSLSDGEEAMLPVISNRMLVTETLPLSIKGTGTKNFNFDKLLKSGSSASLQQKGITVEFTSNPAWFAVQALPYLTEGEKENAEQVFNRYFANALATKIAGSSPRFKQIIEKWKTLDTAALISNLQKNEELKSVLLEETPWVLEAHTETQQKKNISLLFDMTRMSSELQSALNKLKDMQAPTGGFVWFKGGPEDRYMTQYILSGIGHLKKSGALAASDKQLRSIIAPGLSYLDGQIKKDYEALKRLNKKLPDGSLDNITIQYLYMRSFFTDVSVPGDVFAAYNYYRNQSKQSWVKQNSFARGMIALSLYRTGDIQNAQKILRALKETAITSEELGTYWKDVTGGYFWYEAPVETQALLIEAFSEMTSDTSGINNMKTWLLKNKQTNNWKTSRATADACYALLLKGSDWINNEPSVEISLGDKKITAAQTEAGTGFFKQYIFPDDVRPSMGNISVRVIPDGNKQAPPSWGSVYWQYFEDLDKITGAATPLRLSKKLFIEKNTDRGPVLEPLISNKVHIGDKLRVRIELRADRTMEYVHMKDMRASCLEPVDVLSEYKWQDGLGYYETTKDASTDFFFGSLPKGAYVFEYSLYVTASGSFSNGVTTIQCLYAPEFSSHSEGLTLQSENK